MKHNQSSHMCHHTSQSNIRFPLTIPILFSNLHICDIIPLSLTQCLDIYIIGSCTFESGQCGWNDISTGRYNFHRFQGSSPGTGGPKGDHTTNSANGELSSILVHSI